MNTKRITTEIAQAADAIRAGQLVAVPTETVYGLAGNGLDPAAVAQIYEVKGRPAVKPLSLMVHDASAMVRYCADVPPAAYSLAEAFWPGPLTIVLRAQACVPEIVRAGGETVGHRRRALRHRPGVHARRPLAHAVPHSALRRRAGRRRLGCARAENAHRRHHGRHRLRQNDRAHGARAPGCARHRLRRGVS